MRKLTIWVTKDDRNLIAAAVLVAALIAGLTWFVAARGASTIETALYVHPAVVSRSNIDVAERAARALGDGLAVRFVDGRPCDISGAIGCARADRPGVIYLDSAYVSAPETVWYEVRTLAFHEAAHAAAQLHGLDVSAFGEIVPEVNADEAFADCVAAALEGAPTFYLSCPIEWQERSLEVLGFDRLARIWVEGADEPTLGLWR